MTKSHASQPKAAASKRKVPAEPKRAVPLAHGKRDAADHKGAATSASEKLAAAAAKPASRPPSKANAEAKVASSGKQAPHMGSKKAAAKKAVPTTVGKSQGAATAPKAAAKPKAAAASATPASKKAGTLSKPKASAAPASNKPERASKPASKTSGTAVRAGGAGGAAVAHGSEAPSESETSNELASAAAASSAQPAQLASVGKAAPRLREGPLVRLVGEGRDDDDDLDDDDDDDDDSDGERMSSASANGGRSDAGFVGAARPSVSASGTLGLDGANRAFRDDPMLDRRIIEGMLDDKDGFLDDMHGEGFSRDAVVRRAAELGLSEALIRQVKGVAADLAGERPGKRPTPTSLGARTCLQCDRVFFSSGPGNRLCTRCRGGDAGLAQL